VTGQSGFFVIKVDPSGIYQGGGVGGALGTNSSALGRGWVRCALASAAALGMLAVESTDAHAFCRTTSTKAPVGYNPAVSGCWAEGVPVAWAPGRVPYAVSAAASKQVSLADATRAADLAFHAWNAALCDGKPAGVEAYDDGPVAVPDGLEGDALAAWAGCTTSTMCDPTAHDVIVFDDDAWPHNDPVNTLALTTVTYGLDDGQIFEAYTEVNSAQHQITAAEPPPAGSQSFDLQAILTHEAGHFLGFAHATETTSIMYAYYRAGAIDLTPDDVDAICTVYPPAPPQPLKAGCMCSPGAGTSAADGTGPFVAVVAILGSLVRARARRRTPGE
jgi:hypothetical protein